MKNKPSKGIIVIAIAHILFAIFCITQYVSTVNFLLGAGADSSSIFNLSVQFIIISLIFLLFGTGLLCLKNWIRIVSLVVYPIISFAGFAMLWSFLISRLIRYEIVKSFLDYMIEYVPWGHKAIVLLLWIGTSIFNFYYLTRPKIKEQFK